MYDDTVSEAKEEAEKILAEAKEKADEAIGSLAYLKYGLGVILAFIGMKMLLAAADIMHVEVVHSLLFIIIILGITVLASVMHGRKQAGEA